MASIETRPRKDDEEYVELRHDGRHFVDPDGRRYVYVVETEEFVPVEQPEAA